MITRFCLLVGQPRRNQVCNKSFGFFFAISSKRELEEENKGINNLIAGKLLLQRKQTIRGPVLLFDVADRFLHSVEARVNIAE